MSAKAYPFFNDTRSGTTILSWPQGAGLLRLFGTTNLPPPALWIPVNASAVLNNGQWSVPQMNLKLWRDLFNLIGGLILLLTLTVDRERTSR